MSKRSITTLAQQRIKLAGAKQSKLFTNAKLLLWSFPLVTFGLGAWQINRLNWKTSTIDEMQKMTKSDPIPLDASDMNQYSRVKVTGHFLNDKEFHVGPRSYDSAQVGGGIFSTETNTGYYIVTPFKLDPSGTQKEKIILVNRGWVMKDLKESKARQFGLVEEQVTVDGWIRKGDKNNILIPENEIENNQWYTMDVKAMSGLVGGEPVLLEMLTTKEDASGYLKRKQPLPRPFDTNIRIRNTHLEYAITWFGMSIVSAYMLYKKR